jgi:predicted AlkP superfamily phosphohydrolase/phosphomutase
MVDHADNWPPQLIFEPEDKGVFLDEMRMSLDWHRRAVPFVIDHFKPDVFIQDTYTPNQMLESRWWQGRIDKGSKHYSKAGAKDAWKDIHEMYQGLDSIVGEALKKAGDDTLVVFSSDHGVCPLHRLVHLNNLFAKKGWLKFTIDEKTGEPTVDWKNTKVIYLKMLHVYIGPNGLDGNWKRSSGPEYEKLRNEVIEAVNTLEDKNGERPLVRATKWEDAGKIYDLPMDRIGDLVLETKVNYFWYEEMSKELELFSDPLTSGYKQSLDPQKNECMWTPFLVWGPGVRKGYKIPEPISHIDQLPTLLKLMDIKAPPYVQGRVLKEAID